MSRRIRQAALAFFVCVAPGAARRASASVVGVAHEAGGWVLRVDGQPYFVRGIAYGPERVGEDPNNATLRDWMTYDDNGNGLNDPARESFVDVNGNNVKDASEPAVGDWSLLRDMGVNTIRIYHHPSNDPSVQAGYGSANTRNQYNHPTNTALLRDLFSNYGIRVAMGDFFGAYTVGSGQPLATDYTNAAQNAQVLASVQQMVTDFKGEPWLLMYVLGNENNLSITQTNAGTQPVAYAQLLEQAAQLIHAQDPNHPVAICMGDNASAAFIATLQANAPDIDIIGANVYRYPTFTTFFTDAKGAWDKPVMFTEYGDLQSQFIAGDLDTSRQAAVHAAALAAIENNAAGGAGTDTSIGGVAFAWLDSWWQSGSPTTHDILNNFPTTVDNEWHGVASQGNGARSPLLRQLRPVYFQYQSHWSAQTSHFIGAGGGSVIVNDSNGFSTLQFPAGTFASSGTVVVTAAFSFTPGDNSALNMSPTGVGFTLSETAGQQPSRPVTIYFPFAHNGRGFVLARYDAPHNAWVPLPTRRDAAGYLIADTSHFSEFQVFEAEKSPSVDNAIVFPNPARPALGQHTITVTQVPPGTHLKLYTSSGELVRELFADAAGIATWDLQNRDGRDAASGVYFAVVDGAGGPRTLKLAVQR